MQVSQSDAILLQLALYKDIKVTDGPDFQTLKDSFLGVKKKPVRFEFQLSDKTTRWFDIMVTTISRPDDGEELGITGEVLSLPSDVKIILRQCNYHTGKRKGNAFFIRPTNERY